MAPPSVTQVTDLWSSISDNAGRIAAAVPFLFLELPR